MDLCATATKPFRLIKVRDKVGQRVGAKDVDFNEPWIFSVDMSTRQAHSRSHLGLGGGGPEKSREGTLNNDRGVFRCERCIG